MTELEKMLAEISAFLEEDLSAEMPAEELSVKLNKLGREIGKKQSRVSSNSEEHKELSRQRELVEQVAKVLRDMEKEASGLMFVSEEEVSEITDAVPQAEVQDEEKGTIELIRRLSVDYSNSRYKKDVSSMQRIYRDIYKEAEVGESSAIHELALIVNDDYDDYGNKGKIVRFLKLATEKGNADAAKDLARFYRLGNLVQKNLEKAREYLDIAAERENTVAMYLRACELAGIFSEHGYQRDEEAAYQQFKAYITKVSPLDMESKEDRRSLFQCYYLGAKTGHDMDKEEIPEPWQRLLEVPGDYTEVAKELPGDILVAQGRYEEAVQVYLEVNNVYALDELKNLFFHEYFKARPELRRKLEDILIKMRDSEDTKSGLRENLYSWYGWRYENGKDVVEDVAIAYVYYGKAANIGGWKKYEDYRNRILRPLDRSKKIVFFKNVMEQGYMDVAKELGDMYQEKFQYDMAKIYYQEGAESAHDEEVREACRKGYTRCKEALNKRQAFIEECEPAYNQCNTSSVAMKKEGFMRMLAMAKNGNSYACLRVAQLAEKDTYLKENVADFPSDEEISNYYMTAAYEGEIEAIYRMVEIYEKGEFGHRIIKSEAERWRGML